MSVKFLYSDEKTNSFRPEPWHFSGSPFPAYRGAGARYSAFLAVARDYAPAFAGAAPSADGYSCPQVSFDTAPSRLITTRVGQKLLLVPCAPELDELTLLLTLRGGFRGWYSRVVAVGAEILLDRNSEPRNISFCPTRHLIVRLTHPNGYVFAETGRRRGTGLVEVFSWQGYHTFTTEEFETWKESFAPDTSEETKAVRRAELEIARLEVVKDREAKAKAEADAEAARRAAIAESEEASRKSLAGFLPRLEALQSRLQVLRVDNPDVDYCELQIGETYFTFGQESKLYNEENIAEAERNVSYWEQQSAARQQRAAIISRFEAFAPRLSNFGLSLHFSHRQVTWLGAHYNYFSYDEAGLAACEAALVCLERAAAKTTAKSLDDQPPNEDATAAKVTVAPRAEESPDMATALERLQAMYGKHNK